MCCREGTLKAFFFLNDGVGSFDSVRAVLAVVLAVVLVVASVAEQVVESVVGRTAPLKLCCV